MFEYSPKCSCLKCVSAKPYAVNDLAARQMQIETQVSSDTLSMLKAQHKAISKSVKLDPGTKAVHIAKLDAWIASLERKAA